MTEDLLKSLEGEIDFEALQPIREEREKWLSRPSQEKFKKASLFTPLTGEIKADFTGPEIIIGSRKDLNEKQHRILRKKLETFIPWRKGPFNIFGRRIDAEWQSNRKFDRILPHLDSPEEAAIADIGANNGYYMFRLSHYKPKAVIGFEPTVRHYFLVNLLKSFVPNLPIQMELLGGEHLVHFRNVFDIVLCLGVLYHYYDPIGMLKGIFKSLKPEGQIIVESQGIPGDTPVCLFPEKRYGKVPGTWFVPTAPALVNWLKRSGFKDVEFFYGHAMNSEEQRRTEWMPWESYEDFIDGDDPGKTVEGYPAPHRFYIKGRKRLN